MGRVPVKDSDSLEKLVQERTAEQVKVNEALQAEIGERMRAEEALRKSESRYRTLFESIDEGYCIIEVIFDENDKPVDYRFLEINPSFEAQTGLVDAQGKRMRELAPLHEAFWFEIYGRIALTGVPARFQHQAKQLHRWYDVYSFRFGPPENHQVAILFNDITKRKQSEQELIKSEIKFAKIFNAAPSSVIITSLPEGRVMDVNETALRTLGFQREEMIGRTTRELGLWAESAERTEMLQALEEQGSLRNLEIRFKRKSGQTLVGLMSAEIIELDHGRYMLSQVQDITERKAAEEEIARLNADLEARVSELEGMNRELEAFNRMVSHDLLQPLNTIGLSCQELAMIGDHQEERYKHALDVAKRCVMRMGALIETLLSFSRSTHGDLERREFCISDIAKSVMAETFQTEPRRRVKFKVAEGVMANGDPKYLRVVLANLIGNAWKYTAKRKEGFIEFGVTQIDGNQTYFIRDNGRGFHMVDAGKLFIPFQRLDDTGEYQGFGIGLATVERIIRRHGGRIWAEGEPDRGATFYFTMDVPDSGQ